MVNDSGAWCEDGSPQHFCHVGPHHISFISHAERRPVDIGGNMHDDNTYIYITYVRMYVLSIYAYGIIRVVQILLKV